MSEMIQKLPIDLSRKICNYIACPQPAALMEDIRNYRSSYDEILSNYKTRCKQFEHIESSLTLSCRAHHWVTNDLLRYHNSNRPTMYGYLPKIYEIFGRIEPIWDHKMLPAEYLYQQAPPRKKRRPIAWYRIDCYISRYWLQKPPQNQVRIFWGLMTPVERRAFAKYMEGEMTH